MHTVPEGKTVKVGVLGATGTVGQRFIALLENHPYFVVHALWRVSAVGRQDIRSRYKLEADHTYPLRRARSRSETMSSRTL